MKVMTISKVREEVNSGRLTNQFVHNQCYTLDQPTLDVGQWLVWLKL